MKICFYSPYFPQHFGGGEKHLLDVAITAAEQHEVCIAINQTLLSSSKEIESVKKSYENFFGQSLKNTSFVKSPLGSNEFFVKKALWTKQFDAIYYVTDGSFFFSLAKHNFLHIQVPLTTVRVGGIDSLKLHNWKHINTNSLFTKKVVEEQWKLPVTEVLYPVINTDEFKDVVPKKNYILSVGRFFTQLHSKRQDVLISIFKKMYDQNKDELKNWRLLLVGKVEDETYLSDLKEMSKGYPIEIMTDLSRSELITTYQQAKIYWHAAGFGINETREPEKVEHFGISTVEAMAAGAIPLVVPKGGQKEIIMNYLDELGWNTEDECSTKTLSLIKDTKKQEVLSQEMVNEVKQYDERHFKQKVLKMFSI